MTRIIAHFITTSVLKGIFLFIVILLGDYFEAIPILLRVLVFFVLIGFLDMQILYRIRNSITDYRFLKALAFSYLSFVSILWITGPLFGLYNYVTDKVIEGNVEMPTIALVGFLILGLVVSIISSLIWTNRNK